MEKRSTLSRLVEDVLGSYLKVDIKNALKTLNYVHTMGYPEVPKFELV